MSLSTLWKAKRKRFENEEELEEEEDLIIRMMIEECMRREKIPHGPCLFRKRWDLEYLVDLAVKKEGTFTTEHRVNPR
jgi:hypothetical protein